MIALGAKALDGFPQNEGISPSEIAEQVLAAVPGVLPPAPPSAPEKSENEQVAERIMSIFRANRLDTFPAHVVQVIDVARDETEAALDARDKAHAETLRKELEALREACVTKAVKTPYAAVANEVSAVPLTIAEREGRE